MHWFCRILGGEVGGLMLLCGLGTYVHAACPGLTDVISGDVTVNACLTKQALFDFQMKNGTPLKNLKNEMVDPQGPFLKEDFEHQLPYEIDITLRDPVVVQEKPGKSYLIPGGKTVKYTVPASHDKVTIPKGKTLIKKDGATPSYTLGEDITVSIVPPLNTRLTFKISAQTVVERIPGASGMGTTLTFEPSQAPVGKYVSLEVAKSGFDFSKAEFSVCFKGGQEKSEFTPSDSVELKEVQIGRAKLRARIPPITGISGVHLAKPVDLLVVARADGNLAEVVSKEFQVSSRSLAIICWITAFVIPWLIAAYVSGRRGPDRKWRFDPIWFVSGKFGGASLSLAQILLWTILVISASFYVLVASGKLLDLSNEVLILLGIAGGSSVIAKIAAAAKDEKGAAIIKAELKGKEPEPKWLDLLQTDGQADLYKFQMALFTALAAVFVTLKIFSTLEFPTLPAGLLTLIGISNGVYLAAKGTSKTVFEKLGEKSDELQKAEEELAKCSKEATDAENTLKELETKKGKVKQKRADIEVRKTTASEAEKATLEKQLEQLTAEAQTAEASYQDAEQKKQASGAAKNAAGIRRDQLKAEYEKLKKEAKEALG